MKKINIVTFCTYKSLGSILQSYSLATQLSKMGHYVVVLLDKKENIYQPPKINSLKNFIKRIHHNFIFKKVRLAYKKRTGFIKKNIKICEYTTYMSLVAKTENDDCDLYISGSDQVWHPVVCNPIFFLDFVNGKKCISYAASMGQTLVPEQNMSKFSKLINNFELISVREEENVEVIKNITSKNIEVHIDPTFLMDANEWRKLEKPYKIKKPYILVYMLYWNKNLRDEIAHIKRATGLQVYAIADGLSKVYADKFLYDVGVEEFLWLFDNAEYIITSSFHGVAFSIIFNKKFSAIVNPNSPSRINNILSKLELPFVEIRDLLDFNEYNYENCNQLIKKERKKSIEYLKKGIEDEHNRI